MVHGRIASRNHDAMILPEWVILFHFRLRVLSLFEQVPVALHLIPKLHKIAWEKSGKPVILPQEIEVHCCQCVP